MVFLNWYDTGQLDFSSWLFMALGGFIFGIIVLRIEKLIFQSYSVGEMKGFIFILIQVLLNWLGLVGSFSVGYAVGLMVTAKDIVELSSLLKGFWIIPLISVFYFVMMFPFGVYLGITNIIWLRLGYRSIKR